MNRWRLVVMGLLVTTGLPGCVNILQAEFDCVTDDDCPFVTPRCDLGAGFCVDELPDNGACDGDCPFACMATGFCDPNGDCVVEEAVAGLCGDTQFCDPKAPDRDDDGCAPCDCPDLGCHTAVCSDTGECLYDVNPAFQCAPGQRCDATLGQLGVGNGCVDAAGSECLRDGSDGGCGVGLFCFVGGCAVENGTCNEVDDTLAFGGAEVCGCDGRTYGSQLDANLAGFDAVDGACGDAVACTDNEGCADDEYCRFPPRTCGIDGVCAAQHDGCFAAVQGPVCGCGGTIPFDSACEAQDQGASIFDDGAACSGGGHPITLRYLAHTDTGTGIVAYRVVNQGDAPISVQNWIFRIVDGANTSFSTIVEGAVTIPPGGGLIATTDPVGFLSAVPDPAALCDTVLEMNNAPAQLFGTERLFIEDDTGLVRDAYGTADGSVAHPSYQSATFERDPAVWSSGEAFDPSQWAAAAVFDLGAAEPDCP